MVLSCQRSKIVTIPDWIPEVVAIAAIAVSGGALTYNNSRLARIEKKHDDDLKAVYDRINDCSSDIYDKMDILIKEVLDAIKENKKETPSIDTCKGVQALFDNKLTGVAASLEQLAQAVENLRVDVSDIKSKITVNK